MKIKKKDIRKIKTATREELGKLQKEYQALMESTRHMSPAGLMMIAIAGILVILYFRNNLLDLIGLILLLYPLYIFIRRGAHREGYFEGYYDMMTKFSKTEDTKSKRTDSEKSGKE